MAGLLFFVSSVSEVKRPLLLSLALDAGYNSALLDLVATGALGPLV